MTYFIDTNIFLRTLVKEDETSFQECLQFLTKVKQGQMKAVTNSLVLAEVAWTLRSYYRLSRPEIAQALESILSLRNLKFRGQQDYWQAVQLYRNGATKYIDCTIAAIPELRQHEWEIVSYDRELDGFELIRKEPIQV